MTAVWVVSFTPHPDEGGVGGFNWSLSLTEAARVYVARSHEARNDQSHVVRLVRMQVPYRGIDLSTDDPLTRENCTAYLEVHSDEYEERLPASLQFVPDGWPQPTGGVVS